MSDLQPPFKKTEQSTAVRRVASEIHHAALVVHERRDAALRKAVKSFAAEVQDRTEFEEKYGRARRALATKMGDKWLVAIGEKIVLQTQEGHYDFLNVLHDHALDFLGSSFIEEQQSKPRERRHPVARWLMDTVENSQRARESADEKVQEQIGSGAAWFRFAYDLFTIADNAELQKVMKARLTGTLSFQGARHELRIAALCIAAGFTLDFQDESDNKKTHFEFVATDPESGLQIAVEAKSRHRKGVQGFELGKDVKAGSAVDIRKLVVDAYQKKTEFPFYIFVDVNLPAANAEAYASWTTEIETTMDHLVREGYSPSPANAVFFSNDPSHYVELGPIGGNEDMLWLKYVLAQSPRTPHPDVDVVSKFMKAFRQRIVAPRELKSSGQKPW